MRIPSQFNEDNLFRRGDRRNESAQSYRQLLRLVIGLTLVIVVMRQASKPAIYQPFFGEPASAAGGAAPQAQARLAGGSDLDRLPDSIDVQVAAGDREVANLLTSELSPSEQRQWVVALSRWQSGRSIEQLPTSVDAVLTRLDSLQGLSNQQRLAWKAMIGTILSGSQASSHRSPGDPTTVDRSRLAALLAALDDAAASRVVDGSVWRSGDFDLFYRYLDQAETLPAAGVATSGVLPLLQQPDVFRNQLVRISGTVARTERIEARENPYGIDDYWQLWIRPADGADRPLVAVVPAVPTLIAAVGPEAVNEQGPRVAIVGWFFKRLAYQSALGADLAPVVIGRIVFAPITEEEITDANRTGGADQSDVASNSIVFLTLTMACLIGLGVAMMTMWRTSVMAKRARQLRNDNRRNPTHFLRELKQQSDSSPALFDPSSASDREADR